MNPIETISLRAYLKAANRYKAKKEFLYDEYKECLDVIAHQPVVCTNRLEDILEHYQVSSIIEFDLQWLRAFAASSGHAAAAYNGWSMETEILYDWLIIAGFDIEYEYETNIVYPIDHVNRLEMWDDILAANIELEKYQSDWESYL